MTESFRTLQLDIDNRGVARLTLDRPDARNALSQEMIGELRAAAHRLADDEAVRVVVLSGAGDVFCAGGDLKGMRDQAVRGRAERIADAEELARLLYDLDRLPKFVVGRINGPAYGGGLGLISVCDTAIGLAGAAFRLTEVRLGLIPATISPYVVARIGAANARRLMLNARGIDDREAVRVGLLSRAVEPGELDDVVEEDIQLALGCAPGAVARCKELIRTVDSQDAHENIRYTAERLADAWESDETREGIAAFLEKRKPRWANEAP